MDALLSPADAVEAVEGCFARLASGAVENRPRFRLGLDDGRSQRPGRCRPRARRGRPQGYAAFRSGARCRRPLRRRSPRAARARRGRPLGTTAHRSRERRGRQAPGASRRPHARRHRSRLAGGEPGGVPACRAPGIDRVVAYSRAEERLDEFCRRFDAEPAEYNRDAAEQDIVVTITTLAIRCCAANGCGRARWSAPRARTGSTPASSTTRSSSAPPSSAATRRSRPGWKRPTSPSRWSKASSTGSRCTSSPRSWARSARTRARRGHRPLQEPRHRCRGHRGREGRLRPRARARASGRASRRFGRARPPSRRCPRRPRGSPRAPRAGAAAAPRWCGSSSTRRRGCPRATAPTCARG